jgi:metallo-beta-lactamase family protein
MILFVGYQAVGTTGRKIIGGAKHVTLFNEDISVQAEIGFLPGKSGHADRDGLLRWITAFDPKPAMVFVNHGDDAAVKAYANTLADEYGFTVGAPYSGAVFDLAQGVWVKTPEGVPVAKKTVKTERAAAAYAALAAAGERLQKIIAACRSIPNKELARFTGQLNSLADKWQKWAKK